MEAEVTTNPGDHRLPQVSRFWQLAKITSGSFAFMLLKLCLVAGIHYCFEVPAWLNYGIVTVSVSLLGWVYHSKVSFAQPLTRQTLIRYIQQAVVLKTLDYSLYNLFVYIADIDLRLAVLVTSGIVFVVRVVVYVKYVFVPVDDTTTNGR